MKLFLSFSILVMLFGSIELTDCQNTTDTRLLQMPAISRTHIAFIYANDLWIANPDGSNPRRLTIDKGIESNPVFSPDGSLIAFSAQYDGNTDVYVIPSSGGIPTRLTWHPSFDYVNGFTPDGQSILFFSQRTNHTRAHTRLYTVDVNGGMPRELEIPVAFKASLSPDGQYIAYTPNFEAFRQWKHYRGGTQSRIWIYNTSTKGVQEIPKPETGANDTNPQWIGSDIFFRSDRNGEFNLYSYNMLNNEVRQHTNHPDFPVISLNTNDSLLIYEQAGYLHTYEVNSGKHQKLKIGIAADLLELRTRFVTGNQYIRSASVSPSGARTAFDFRGEIVTVPKQKGDVQYLTQTPGIHEKYPAWSPDGKYLAYFSDASGEYALHLRSNLDNKIQSFALNGKGFYSYIHWAPDSRKVCFADNGRNLYVLDIESGLITKIAEDMLYVPGPFRELFGSWSHDSRYISYTIVTGTNFEQAYIYDLEQNTSHAISDGLSNVSEPVFDPSGKYIYMLASTDAGPLVNWFDQSNQDMEMSYSIYLVTLQKDIVSPLAKENDVEEPKLDKSNGDKKDSLTETKPLTIDWEHIQNRIIALPVKAGAYSNLRCAEKGVVYYLAADPHAEYNALQQLKTFNLKDRKEKDLFETNGFMLSANGKKMLYQKGEAWGIVETGKTPDNGKLKTSDIKVKIDPAQEWVNIFNEAWRVNRDYFYDPKMHGADWDTIKAKYEQFLPDITCPDDLYRIMQWMFSELAVGHHRFTNHGDRMYSPEKVNVGLLGADYGVQDNRYRFTKIYGGLNWTPDLRSPLTEPGIDINVDDYLIAIDGQAVTADQNLYRYFENKADKIVKLTVSVNASGSDSREVQVVPLGNENELRNRDWIENNIKKVNAATNGQVAYVYVPNTAGKGHAYFKRYFFPQVNKKAIIIDERYNGGGLLADYYIDMLRKPFQSYWNFRYGKDIKAPSASIQGPKVMLIDETAGSGGDYLPWMFRKFGLGKLIGKTTWGGLVGILGFPEFIDGGAVTAPNLAFWNEEGFRIENEGIAPDIKVEQWPQELIDGHDPQLEKAIEVILEELKNNPPQQLIRPAHPVKVRPIN